MNGVLYGQDDNDNKLRNFLHPSGLDKYKQIIKRDTLINGSST